jgi:hypothetical protein
MECLCLKQDLGTQRFIQYCGFDVLCQCLSLHWVCQKCGICPRARLTVPLCMLISCLKGLTGCIFVFGDQGFFFYCSHNFHSLYMAILCDIQNCFFVIFAQKLSLVCRVSIGTLKIIWLLLLYCIKCGISLGQGNYVRGSQQGLKPRTAVLGRASSNLMDWMDCDFDMAVCGWVWGISIFSSQLLEKYFLLWKKPWCVFCTCLDKKEYMGFIVKFLD